MNTLYQEWAPSFTQPMVASLYIVGCQRGGVSEETPWLRARDETRASDPLKKSQEKGYGFGDHVGTPV